MSPRRKRLKLHRWTRKRMNYLFRNCTVVYKEPAFRLARVVSLKIAAGLLVEEPLK